MNAVELILILLATSVVLAIGAERLRLPYPIVLVVGGVVLAFGSGLPRVAIPPELVLVIFLPPLLFSAAWFTSWRDFAANLRSIGLLAIGLVVATTVGVAAIAHALIPGMPWQVAFVLGAIVSPPDAVAATAVMQRLHVPRRLVTVLEGESLVNDATGLVAFQVALAAVLSGGFSATHALGQFAIVAIGGIAAALRQEREGLLRGTERALERLRELDRTSIIVPWLVERLRATYEERVNRLQASVRDDPECRLMDGENLAYQRLRAQLINAERASVVALRNRGEISEEVLHKLQQDLDLEALQPLR